MFRGLARAAKVHVKNRSMFRRLSGSEMITDTMSMSELRRIVRERQLPISTAGRGRTRDKVLSDIKAALASETELKPAGLAAPGAPTPPRTRRTDLDKLLSEVDKVLLSEADLDRLLSEAELKPAGLAEPGAVTSVEEFDPSQQQQQDQAPSNEQSTFSFYLEQSALGGEPHPSKLVETTTLASVRGPPVTAQLFGGGAPPAGLSNVQLEAIALATQAHDDERALREQGSRRGLLCGDDTGCGKGRTIAGCVLHNYGAGRQRSVWVTASAGLARDARRDLDDIEGGKAVPLKLQASVY